MKTSIFMIIDWIAIVIIYLFFIFNLESIVCLLPNFVPSHAGTKMPPGYQLLTNGKEYKYNRVWGTSDATPKHFNFKYKAVAHAWSDYNIEQRIKNRMDKDKWKVIN